MCKDLKKLDEWKQMFIINGSMCMIRFLSVVIISNGWIKLEIHATSSLVAMIFILRLHLIYRGRKSVLDVLSEFVWIAFYYIDLILIIEELFSLTIFK